MSKRSLFFLTCLFFMICTPQSTMAKVKKVVYMGHNYKGEVNNNKEPEGEGRMGFGDLANGGFVLNGLFNLNTVTNGTIDESIVKLRGTFVFDESNTVILKAGGTLSYVIIQVNEYNRTDKEGEREITDTISSDLRISQEYFQNLKTCEVTYSIKPTDIERELNPPTEFLVKQILPLKKYSEYSKITQKYYDQIGFVDLSEAERKQLRISNFTDNQGRKWDYHYTGTTATEYTVTYPDGSYASNTTNGKVINPNQTYYLNSGDWQIVNPEYYMMGIGKNVKITFKGENYRIILYDNGGSAGEELINGEKDKLYIYGSKWENSNYIGIFGVDSLPLQDIYKIIKEKLLPLVYVDNDDYLSVYNGSKDNYIGSLSKSGFKTKVQMNQMDKDREQAKRQALIKKYGKVYVDAINNNKLMVGMPIKLLINDASWVNVYKMYMYNNGESGQFKVDILVEGTASNGWFSGAGVYHRTYRVWVKNWKITQFRNWTNSDEREFKGL